MILYGSSGIGEPEYAGAIYSPDLASFAELGAVPAVELELQYDPTPAPSGFGWKVPAWLILLGVTYVVARQAALRVGGA